MKKTIRLVASVLALAIIMGTAVLITGCTVSDKSSSVQSKLIGSWEESTYGGSTVMYKSEYVFNEDGKGFIKYFYSSHDFQWSYDNDIVTITYKDLESGDKKLEKKIISISETELVWCDKDDDENDKKNQDVLIKQKPRTVNKVNETELIGEWEKPYWRLLLNADGTGMDIGEYSSTDFTWTLSGDELRIYYKDRMVISYIRIDGDKLLFDEGEEGEYTRCK